MHLYVFPANLMRVFVLYLASLLPLTSDVTKHVGLALM